MPQTAELRTLLLTDLVGSTAIVERLGDVRSAELFARIDRLTRDLLAAHNGREIDRTDGFLLLFERPGDAVRFALAQHAALAALSAEVGEPLASRTGIHLGEVVFRRNAPEDIARGAKPLEVEGLAKPFTARVMSLALGGQTLLTRGAFDVARRAAVGDDSFPTGTSWLAHGPYLLKGIEEPVDIFEVGLAGRAPLAAPPDTEKARRALRPGEEELLGWRPASGQEVRRRPGWILERKLGEGGFGEVWLARHAKTRERRVFKFCFAYERLKSLKRELTLFLLMKEALGQRDDIQRLYDLNFEEAPYFLEMDYTEGGDLQQWAEKAGGISSVPLATRLELLAQAADAAAAAHSIGIIHKDIKPSNILVEDGGRRPQAKLTDFGIGQLADKSILGQVQVSATGFTASTLAHTELSSRTGTRLYMAPELLAGKLPSIQSDVYALGVMLFQLLIGDLGAPLPSDWQRRVPDPLLREDIASCVAGDQAERLTSAADLATRLRTLAARRRARRRRLLLKAAAASTIVLAALLAGTLLVVNRERARAELERELRESAQRAEYEARQQRDKAIAAQSEAEALVDFMMGDLVAKLQPIGRLDIMDDVLTKVDELLRKRRVKGLTPPEQRALFSLLRQVSDVRLAQGKLQDAERAARSGLEEALVLAAADPTSTDWWNELGAFLSRIGRILVRQGKLDEAQRAYEQALEQSLKLQLAAPHNPTYSRQLAVAWVNIGDVMVDQGQLVNALEVFGNARRTLEALLARTPQDETTQRSLVACLARIGEVFRAQDDLENSLKTFQNSLDISEMLASNNPDNQQLKSNLAAAWNRIGGALQASGRRGEALEAFRKDLEISKALALIDPSNSEWQSDLSISWMRNGDLLQSMGMLKEAQEAFEQSLRISERLATATPDDTKRLRELGVAWMKLGSVLDAQRRLDESRVAILQGLEVMEKLAESDPSNVAWQSDVAIGWLGIGHIDLALARPFEARESFQKSLAIRRRLALGDPTDADRQADVAGALNRIGDTLVAEARLQEARLPYSNAVDILTQLQEANPAHPERVRQYQVASQDLLNLDRALLWCSDRWGVLPPTAKPLASSTNPSNLPPQTRVALYVFGPAPKDEKRVSIAFANPPYGESWKPNFIFLELIRECSLGALWKIDTTAEQLDQFKLTFGRPGEGWSDTEEWRGQENRRFDPLMAFESPSTSGEITSFAVFGLRSLPQCAEATTAGN